MKNEIRLIKKFVYGSNLKTPDFCIYEVLADDLKHKHKCNYFVSQGEFSPYALENMGADQLINQLKNNQYEDKFETLKEAILHIKYTLTDIQLRRLERKINALIAETDLDKTRMTQTINQCNELL